ncbi:MAG: hypothetical protein QOD98_1050 [Nocardioidaceae bacterium]|nr:hypothetical protein [Nocardioidaceae bacterium]
MPLAADFHYVAPVTTPDERADNHARNAAIKTVDEALKSGRIVQADHDMRVDQLRGAQTMQDIDLAVRDLRAAPPAAPATIAPVPPTPTGQQSPSVIQDTGGQSWPLVNYGPGSGGSGAANVATAAGKSGGRAIGGIIAAIILVAVIVPIAGAVIAFVSARDSFPDFGGIAPTDDTTYLPGQAPGKGGVNVHTVDGYNEMVDALRAKTDSTFAFSAVIYPRYAVLEVPTGTNNRYQDFYWNGEKMDLEDIKGTTDDGQLDLSLVDPQILVDCLTTVHDRMDTPTSWYLIIGNSFGGGSQISCYASNEFSESTYLIEGLDGTVIYDSALDVQPTPPSPTS